jgi:hypothetical protein
MSLTGPERTMLIQNLKKRTHKGTGEVSFHHFCSNSCESKCLISVMKLVYKVMTMFKTMNCKSLLIILLFIYTCTWSARLNRCGSSLQRGR